MLTFPNAKINLGLNVVEKRNDSFHNIESVFYPIAWADALEMIPAEQLSFNSTGLTIPGEISNNLILKAFELLKNKGLLYKQQVKIHLHKILPMGAGIGGGSADAAFALKMLNQIFELQLNTSTLETYASELGSDCAFFIENTPTFCFGRGNEFEKIDLSLKGKTIVLVYPQIHISTAEAYANVKVQKPKNSIRDSIMNPISTWREHLINDFETGLIDKYPKINQIKNQLYDLGAEYASMTGSGSTVFGIFETENNILESNFKDCVVWTGKCEY